MRRIEVHADRSLRVSPDLWLDQPLFLRLLDELDARRGLFDELALFSSITHAPIPIGTVAERMTDARVQMAAARERGYKAGINVLATIGHHEENLPHSVGSDIGFGMDIDGRECRGSLCPTSELLFQRIKEQYALVVAADPDFIWVDDDVRLLGHMPVRATCFCDRCLDRFSEDNGSHYTRPSLKVAFDSGSVSTKLAMRKAWLQHNRNTIGKILSVVEEAVHTRRPDLTIGFMTGERFFEGYDFSRWSHLLQGTPDNAVRWRPGGGFYSDREPDLLVEKTHQIGRQCAVLPDRLMETVQAELENFPYQRLSKSETITLAESAADIAAGCTGIAYNILPPYPADFEEVVPLLDAIHRGVPFLDQVADAFYGARRSGLMAGWNLDSMATANLSDGSWLEGGMRDFSAGFPLEMYLMGIPPGYSREDAAVTALKGESVAAMGDDEIQALLAGGIYMDGEALSVLCDQGYQRLVGFTPGRRFQADCIEVLSMNSLNGDVAGRKRDTRQSFWHETAQEILPTNSGSRILSRAVDYAGDEVCKATMGFFENELGGRVCISGYSPWTMLHSMAKCQQIKSIMRWLSGGTLGAYVSSYHRISVWYARNPKGKPVIAALNCSADAAIGAQISVYEANDRGLLIDDLLNEVTISPCDRDGSHWIYEIPRIEPWHMALIRF